LFDLSILQVFLSCLSDIRHVSSKSWEKRGIENKSRTLKFVR
jgi:hypothetical protein